MDPRIPTGIMSTHRIVLILDTNYFLLTKEPIHYGKEKDKLHRLTTLTLNQSTTINGSLSDKDNSTKTAIQQIT